MAAANLAHAPPPPVPNLARAVGAPPGKRIEVVWERENTLLSFGRAAAHAAVAFVKFNVQVYIYSAAEFDVRASVSTLLVVPVFVLDLALDVSLRFGLFDFDTAASQCKIWKLACV